VQTRRDLKKYLLDSDAGFIDPQGGRQFNLVDIVLIAGRNNVTPWSYRNKEVFSLIKLCLKINKPVLCSASSMLTFVFQCASDIDTVSFVP
jgi:hypothetical protein